MFKKIFLHSLKKYLILLGYSLVIVVIYNLIHNNWISLSYYSNAFCLAGFSIICFGILSIVNHAGAFNMMSYLFVRRDSLGHKQPYYDYVQEKTQQRKEIRFYFVPYFCVGGLCLILSICFLLGI
ncbi:MAG: DUF3899 domain-containing protein [Anaeroplasmataceae bacterium]|nr:DUF3899 domain-containing protein [Anaeroplasmataceae bacterium]